MVVPLDIIRYEFRKQPEYFMLIQTNAVNYASITNDIIWHLTEDMKGLGIYVSTTKPFPSTMSGLAAGNLNTSKMVFIDCVAHVRTKKERPSNVIGLIGTKGFTELGLAIDTALKAIEIDTKFVFFDSLNQLLAANQHDDVITFLQLMNAKVKDDGLKCAMIIVEQDEIVADVCQMFDKVLRFKGG